MKGRLQINSYENFELSNLFIIYNNQKVSSYNFHLWQSVLTQAGLMVWLQLLIAAVGLRFFINVLLLIYFFLVLWLLAYSYDGSTLRTDDLHISISGLLPLSLLPRISETLSCCTLMFKPRIMPFYLYVKYFLDIC